MDLGRYLLHLHYDAPGGCPVLFLDKTALYLIELPLFLCQRPAVHVYVILFHNLHHVILNEFLVSFGENKI